jgi:prepilin-type N-terminal cleavage/methylation domain-containing protein
MSKPFSASRELRRPRGFTLVELMVAMSLALLLLAIAFNLLDQLNNAADLAGTMAEVNQNLRAGANLVARDLTTAGGDIPLGGIPLPGGGTGSTAATAVKMPGPSTCVSTGVSPRYFNPGAGGNLAVITPGPGCGPTAGSGTFGTGTASSVTDVITVITIDPVSTLNMFPLASMSYAADGSSATITVNAGTNIASGVSQVVPGQLIMLENSSSCVLAVSTVNTTTNVITFNKGDAVNDPLGFNQFPMTNGPTTGTIAQLPAVAANTKARHLKMITYYLDTSKPQRLMKLVGTGAPLLGTPPTTPSNPAQPVALGINVLQFSYDLSDGVTINVRSVASPNLIRKVNLWMIATADHPSRKSRKYYSNTIATSLVVQNLAFFNKYGTAYGTE